MPELFPNVLAYVLCGLVVAGAQFLYATVGFGAGMFSIALLALVLPDLASAVATLLMLTLLTETWVLAHEWRHARIRLLMGLLPTALVGMWVGTEILVTGDVAWLKRGLGVVVALAGVWFLWDERLRNSAAKANDSRTSHRMWISLPVGLASGTLAGMFGTGGPPVIILLRGYGLDKGAFRATMLWYFLLLSIVRTTSYLWAGALGTGEVLAAVWLLPPSIMGILAGMAAHKRLAERHFGTTVSVLLVVLGALLLSGLGR